MSTFDQFLVDCATASVNGGSEPDPTLTEPCVDCSEPRFDFSDARGYVQATATHCGQCQAGIRDADFGLGADR